MQRALCSDWADLVKGAVYISIYSKGNGRIAVTQYCYNKGEFSMSVFDYYTRKIPEYYPTMY